MNNMRIRQLFFHLLHGFSHQDVAKKINIDNMVKIYEIDSEKRCLRGIFLTNHEKKKLLNKIRDILDSEWVLIKKELITRNMTIDDSNLVIDVLLKNSKHDWIIIGYFTNDIVHRVKLRIRDSKIVEFNCISF